MSNTDKLVEIIEEAMLQVAEKDEKGIGQLINELTSYENTNLPDRIRDLLVENLSLILGDVDEVVSNPMLCKLLLLFTSLNIDTTQLRDALALIGRKNFPDYSDPAGLIRSLGIFDSSISSREIHSRWVRFSRLGVGCIVWHESYHLGEIIEIDAFSDLIFVKFVQKRHFSLVQILTSCSIAKADSTTSKLIRGGSETFNQDTDALEFCNEINSEFIPFLKAPEKVVETLLVPNLLNKVRYDAWRKGNSSKLTENDKMIQKRTWNNARGLEELRLYIKDLKSIKVNNDDEHHVRGLFLRESTKPLSKYYLSECFSLLWERCPSAPWLMELAREMPEDTVAWASMQNFHEVTCKLPIKLNPNWLTATAAAKGQGWLIEAIMNIPLRFWPSPKHPLMFDKGFIDHLYNQAKEYVKKGKASSDAAVWLWRQNQSDASEIFVNPIAIVKILNQTVRGDYIKAQKELFGLILGNSKFQGFLMLNGTAEGINNFVKVIKSTSIFNKGEQQSLLVKIVRQFPHAQSIVEERKKIVARRPQSKVTSYRSLEVRQKELTEIINVKIPNNSAAIAHARSYGDLRENSEFKAAKEEQRLLMARRSELESGIKEVIPTDFSDVCVYEKIIPGCCIEIEIDGKKPEQFHVLGLWDSIPERNILSYDTPLGRILIGKEVGDKFTTPQNLPGIVTSIAPISADIEQWVAPSDETAVEYAEAT